MAHFAKISETKEVLAVLTLNNVDALNADGVEILDEKNVGTVNTSTGVIEISDFNITADTLISIFSRPNSNDIAPKRNQIIEVDLANTTIESAVDTIATQGTSGASEYITTPREK